MEVLHFVPLLAGIFPSLAQLSKISVIMHPWILVHSLNFCSNPYAYITLITWINWWFGWAQSFFVCQVFVEPSCTFGTFLKTGDTAVNSQGNSPCPHRYTLLQGTDREQTLKSIVHWEVSGAAAEPHISMDCVWLLWCPGQRRNGAQCIVAL